MMKEATFDALVNYKGLPVLEICTEKKTGYLAPFRGYCFQVSGTVDGQWDLGSTPVFGLDTFKSIRQMGRSNCGQETTVKYFIGAIAMDAVRDFCEARDEGVPHFYHCTDCDGLRVTFNDWVDATYDLIINGVKYNPAEEVA